MYYYKHGMCGYHYRRQAQPDSKTWAALAHTVYVHVCVCFCPHTIRTCVCVCSLCLQGLHASLSITVIRKLSFVCPSHMNVCVPEVPEVEYAFWQHSPAPNGT